MIMAVMKRFAAPGFWPIEKKTKKFVVAPRPGPHAKEKCIPVALLIRDILNYARSLNETKTILNNGSVKIDGRVRKDPNFPVGLMDVFTIGDEQYRILPRGRGMQTVKIEKKEAGIKLCRIVNKNHVKKKTQLNLHDGKNMLVDKDEYKTGDTLVIDLEKNAIKDVIKMKKGSIGLVVSGKNAGKIGKIEDVIVTKSSQPNKVMMKIGSESYEILKNYVFVVGSDKPMINLGEGK